MATKKKKKEHKRSDEKPQMSKAEKEMFSIAARAHDRQGNPIVWNIS